MSITVHQTKTAKANTDSGFIVDAEIGKALQPSKYLSTSRIWNRFVAAVLVVPALPVVVVFAVAIRLTSAGPAIYRQRRVGKGGRQFFVYKLRTMRNDAEAKSGPVWAQNGDPRITPLGRILRKLHIDELPQLWNVLIGDMALIGPRPERPEFVFLLTQQIPGYLDRLVVLPGITGLAQILLPPDSDVEGVRRKLKQDLDYIHRASVLLDARILSCTMLRLCGIPGSVASRMLGFRLVDSKAHSTVSEFTDLQPNAAIKLPHMDLDRRTHASKPKPR